MRGSLSGGRILGASLAVAGVVVMALAPYADRLARRDCDLVDAFICIHFSDVSHLMVGAFLLLAGVVVSYLAWRARVKAWRVAPAARLGFALVVGVVGLALASSSFRLESRVCAGDACLSHAEPMASVLTGLGLVMLGCAYLLARPLFAPAASSTGA